MTDFQKVGEAEWLLPKEGPMKANIRVFAEEALLTKMRQDRTLMQARNVAQLPGLVGDFCVMADGHEGYGFPIGGVAAFEEEGGLISPGGIGYDINCGVRLISTSLSEKDLRPKLKQLTASLYNNVPSGVGSKSKVRLTERELGEAVTIGTKYALEKGYAVKKDIENCEEYGCLAGADFSKVSDLAKKRGGPQIGTLGSGNHFIEVQRVEKILDPEIGKAFGITHEGQITVMIHSGSRGYGHQICDDNVRLMLSASQKYGLQLPDRELSSVPLGTPEANNYFGAMNSAVNFAFNNRQFMTHWVRQTFAQTFGGDWEKYGLQLVYDVCHNIGKFEEHEVNGKTQRVCVHRKGATRAFWKGRKEIPDHYRNVGQPVIIPGSMNTSSYVLCGLPGAAKSFGSSCHGAGRAMSRGAAIRQFDGTQLQKKMESQGMAVRAPTPKSLAEEAGPAYKDVDAVVRSIEKAGISKIIAKLVPLGVVKG